MNNISVITVTNKIDFLDNILINYRRQLFKNKELIIIINANNIDINFLNALTLFEKDISIYKLDEGISLGECLNFGVSKTKYDILCKFDDDDFYSCYYLDEVNYVFNNVNCDVVGKARCFYYIEKYNTLVRKSNSFDNCYADYITGSTISFYKSIFDKVKFRDISIREDYYFNIDCRNNNFKIYSSSFNNHIICKHINTNNHTFISNVDLLKLTNETILTNVKLINCYDFASCNSL